MNLILCEPHEVGDDGVVHLTGGRATHVRTVLRARVGDTLQIGIVDGPKGRGEILAIDGAALAGGNVRDGGNVRSGGAGGDVRAGGHVRDGGGGGAAVAGSGVTLRCDFEPAAPPRPAVDLLLALPRPKVMRRLWAQLTALGVGRIILTNAARVERHYFDTHVLDEATYRPLLIEGLQQACDTRLPLVSVHRQFRILIEDELEALCDDGVRLVAHPHAAGEPSLTRSLASPGTPRALLAIGPEGGWNAFELTLLERHRFEPFSLGPRVLRTDTACIALLALLHETLRGHDVLSR